MAQNLEHTLALQDQLIKALRRENELQRKIITEQECTIHTLEEQLEKFEQLIHKLLNS